MRLIVGNADDDFEIQADSWEQLAGVIDSIRYDIKGELTIAQERIKLQNEREREMRGELANSETLRQHGGQLEAERAGAVESRDRALEQLEETMEQLAKARQVANDKDRLRRELNSQIRDLRSKLSLSESVNRLGRAIDKGTRFQKKAPAKRKAGKKR